MTAGLSDIRTCPDIKICGLKTPEVVEKVVSCGATHIGFIFFPKSPRHVEPETAADLAELARGQAKITAVTVNADEALLEQIVRLVQPDILQLHGQESPQQVQAIKQRYGLSVMKAFSIREKSDFELVKPYLGHADRLLFDAKAPKGSELPGGNGVSFDWDLLRDQDKNPNGHLDGIKQYMLSGGLNAGNIAEALAKTHASGIDISSGVESSPGEKDLQMIAEFFETVRRCV